MGAINRDVLGEMNDAYMYVTWSQCQYNNDTDWRRNNTRANDGQITNGQKFVDI